jgi:hypothetical protein
MTAVASRRQRRAVGGDATAVTLLVGTLAVALAFVAAVGAALADRTEPSGPPGVPPASTSTEQSPPPGLPADEPQIPTVDQQRHNGPRDPYRRSR